MKTKCLIDLEAWISSLGFLYRLASRIKTTLLFKIWYKCGIFGSKKEISTNPALLVSLNLFIQGPIGNWQGCFLMYVDLVIKTWPLSIGINVQSTWQIGIMVLSSVPIVWMMGGLHSHPTIPLVIASISLMQVTAFDLKALHSVQSGTQSLAFQHNGTSKSAQMNISTGIQNKLH